MTVLLLLVIRAITRGRILRLLFRVFCWYFYIDQSALVVAEHMLIRSAVTLMLIYALLPKGWRERVAAVVKPLLKVTYRIIAAVLSGILRWLRGRGQK